MVREQKLTKFIVTQINDNDRIDLWLHAKLPTLSRSSIKKIILAKKVLINGKTCKASERLKMSDVIEIQLLEEGGEIFALKPVSMPLEIIFEDEHIIVLNKPAGISVHPGAGTQEPTLVEGLLGHVGTLSQQHTTWERPGIVHRLDKDTSGLIVCAKTDEAFIGLKNQFKNKTNIREYIALLDGLLPQNETIVENFLARDPRSRLRFKVFTAEEMERTSDSKVKFRSSKSLFRRVACYAHRIDLVTVKLFTGRTHQIRVHANFLNCPLVGDPLYNKKKDLPGHFSKEIRDFVGSKINRQMLHAKKLGFIHPIISNYLEFEVKPPADFSQLLGILSPYKLS